MAGLCEGGEQVCLCLVQVGPGILGEQWFSGMVPRPAVSISFGNMQILGPHPRYSQTRNMVGANPALTERLCDSPGEPELTKVRK